MGEFTISIAGTAAAVRCSFGSTREYCKPYLTDASAEFSMEISAEDRLREQILLNEEADKEGLRRRVFTEPFLERSAIQRKIAAYVLRKNVLLLHGSTIAADGRAYLFTARCGVGKSTHTRLWREMLGDRAAMVNDDRAFLRFTPEGILAYGSPWSGKHGLDSNICVPLAGICILERGKENRIFPISGREALPVLLDQVYLPDESCQASLREFTTLLAEAVPLWRMTCTPEPEAARMAYAAMSGEADRITYPASGRKLHPARPG